MLSAEAIVTLHDHWTRAWHLTEMPPASADEPSWQARVTLQHRANYDLWHLEDEARTPGATARDLARIKHAIDDTNQRRNDLAEDLDRFLLDELASQGLPNPEAPLHSEPPGLIIDRLSILALKIYHTGEEAARIDAPAGHADRNRERLAILSQQRGDLAACLDALAREVLGGTRRFKIYRQMKMYNDPALNPSIYSKARR
jgi:hypothetical protein